MPPFMIPKNFKFKPIFLLTTNVEVVDVKMSNLSPPIIAYTLEPLVVAFLLVPFAATSNS